MSKALEALEKLNHTICFNINEKTLKFSLDKYDNCDCKDINDFVNCYQTIEKSLKVVDIIRSKLVDFNKVNRAEHNWKEDGCSSPVEYYNEGIVDYCQLTEEEYDLLKEVVL